MGFNDFAQDLLVNDQGMDFLDHTSVLRQPATSMDIQKNIEFFFSPTCPVRKTALVFPTQSKYKRHLTKKHFHEVVLYSCQVFHCKVSCRSKYDMKVHLLRVHNTAKGLVENILSKSQRNCRPNGSFINPGKCTFYGRNSSTADKDVPPMPLVPESDTPVEIPSPHSLELE